MALCKVCEAMANGLSASQVFYCPKCMSTNVTGVTSINTLTALAQTAKNHSKIHCKDCKFVYDYCLGQVRPSELVPIEDGLPAGFVPFGLVNGASKQNSNQPYIEARCVVCAQIMRVDESVYSKVQQLDVITLKCCTLRNDSLVAKMKKRIADEVSSGRIKKG